MTATLTAAERGTLRKHLEARRRQLRAELQSKLSNHDNPALLGLRNRMEETDDWAVADLETALDVAEVARDAAELREVEVAFTRMHDGSYGTCIDCGVSIPFGRLEANPSASRCIACQEKVEAGRRHGSVSL